MRHCHCNLFMGLALPCDAVASAERNPCPIGCTEP